MSEPGFINKDLLANDGWRYEQKLQQKKSQPKSFHLFLSLFVVKGVSTLRLYDPKAWVCSACPPVGRG
jgi:hypothetical protein